MSNSVREKPLEVHAKLSVTLRSALRNIGLLHTHSILNALLFTKAHPAPHTHTHPRPHAHFPTLTPKVDTIEHSARVYIYSPKYLAPAMSQPGATALTTEAELRH